MIVPLVIENSNPDEWTITHTRTLKPVARFKTLAGAKKFYEEVKELDWYFDNPLAVPALTWMGVRDAFRRRGIDLKPDWSLEE